VISAAENSKNKFPKTRFWKENSVEDVLGNTWRLTIQFKHVFLSYLAVQKINTCIAKQCSHVEFSYFVMGFTLGAMAPTTRVLCYELIIYLCVVTSLIYIKICIYLMNIQYYDRKKYYYYSTLLLSIFTFICKIYMYKSKYHQCSWILCVL
jgi:hypothetical protein